VNVSRERGLEAARKGAQSLDDDLIVVGGAAHSDLWMQIIADVTGYPVHTIEPEVEARAQPNARRWRSTNSASVFIQTCIRL
jgi:sugar (pentulose or hexulose) kinase